MMRPGENLQYFVSLLEIDVVVVPPSSVPNMIKFKQVTLQAFCLPRAVFSLAKMLRYSAGSS